MLGGCATHMLYSCRVSFDNAADLLCEKLIELDHAVGDSVIDQVAHIVVESSAPVDRLMEAASSATVLTSNSSVNMDQEIDDFRRHSRQLTQVAVYAAESAPDQQSEWRNYYITAAVCVCVCSYLILQIGDPNTCFIALEGAIFTCRTRLYNLAIRMMYTCMPSMSNG